jgi:ABC-type bacteriocin/lantibiotic exporter with double-glycine peptidase domain
MWLARSSGQYTYISNELFVGIYAVTDIAFGIGLLARGIIFAYSSLRKSTELHNKMFKSVIYATMQFFDTTPLGRVLNAFARHQYAFDALLSDSLYQFLMYSALVLIASIVCMIVMYETVGVFGGAAILATLIMLFMGDAERKLRNKEAVTKSTIFSHLTATLEGLFSIRAYQCQDRFIDIYYEKIDENLKYMFGMMEGNSQVLFSKLIISDLERFMTFFVSSWK